MNLFRWKEKKLRTIWRLEKGGYTSYLIGTAHFSPYRFKKPLTKLIQRAEIILFEAPLDEESMERVVQYGQQGENTLNLYEALHPDVIEKINKLLGARFRLQNTTIPYLDILHPTTPNPTPNYLKGVRPWMAFFTIWSTFLNWKNSMDVEAFHIAQRLGKKIEYLETIEDQLIALDGIPFERIVHYLNHMDRWKAHKDLYFKAFLEGDLAKFFSMTGEFPTRCDSILTKRNPIFFEGIKTFLKKGKTAAFVGVAHIPAIREMFLRDGYLVTQEEL